MLWPRCSSMMIDLDGILALSWNWRKSALLVRAHEIGLLDAMTGEKIK